MRLSAALKSGVPLTVAITAAFCWGAQETRPKEAQGLPPRVSPSEYQAQAQAGAVTIAADWVRHSVPTAQGTLTTEDFVVVETGLFGPPEARIQMSPDDFSLRINGKKTPLRSEPYELVLRSLKDPEWIPPEPPASKSKTSIGGGGQGESSGPPPPVKVPIEVQRVMAQRVQKAALPLGDRPLPQAGLIFFQYRGKAQNLISIELIYSGSAGKVTLTLQP